VEREGRDVDQVKKYRASKTLAEKGSYVLCLIEEECDHDILTMQRRGSFMKNVRDVLSGI
jgi:hypothetical protein